MALSLTSLTLLQPPFVLQGVAVEPIGGEVDALAYTRPTVRGRAFAGPTATGKLHALASVHGRVFATPTVAGIARVDESVKGTIQ
jgi:hypothetical protein